MTQPAPMSPREEASGAAWLSVIAPVSFVAYAAVTGLWLKDIPVIGNIAQYNLGFFFLGAIVVGSVAAISAFSKIREAGAWVFLAPALLGLALNLALFALAAIAFLGIVGLINPG